MIFLAIFFIFAGIIANDQTFGLVSFGFGMIMLIITVTEFVRELQENTKDSTIELCPPHSWVYDIQKMLFCSRCKKRPGEIQTDYDKPY